MVRSIVLRISAASAVGLTATAEVVPVATPTVDGPITGGVHGHALFDSWFDLEPLGYTQSEYFVGLNNLSVRPWIEMLNAAAFG